MEAYLTQQELNLIELIESDATLIEIKAEEHKLLTRDELQRLYVSGKKLLIKARNYVLTIEGNNIRNFEKELFTNLIFISSKEGDYFILNEGNDLPGCMTIEMGSGPINLNSGGKYMVNNFQKIEMEIEVEKSTDKLSLIMLFLQIVIGVLTILLSILYLSGNIGNSSVVIVVPALVCCILASINLGIISFQKSKK